MRSAWFKYNIIAVVLILSLCFTVQAEELKTTIDITKIGKGARPIALGGAYTALADDTFAIFTNPAGLGLQLKPGFTSMSTKLLGSVDYRLLGGSYPLPIGNIAIGYVDATVPGGTRITSNEGLVEEHGEIFYSNRIVTLGYGLQLKDLKAIDFPIVSLLGMLGDMAGDLSIGLNLKMFSQGFTGDLTDPITAQGSDIDFGMMMKLSDSLTIGSVFQNLSKSDDGEMSWSTGENEEIGGSTKLGISYKPLNGITTVFDVELPQTNSPMIMHSGIEWDTSEYLTVRAGLDQNYESIDNGRTGAKTDLSAGVGINFIDGFRFDYAYHSDNALQENSTHYFSFSYFGSAIEKPKIKPKSEDQSEQEEIGEEDEFDFEDEFAGIVEAEEEEEEEEEFIY